ncbi:hypothetical protein EES41_00195 [Streptomyces sp. ADI95-16]|nr:hypothetical protein EES41_00195 [Streptomyces sp. ADI95-16]
MAAPATAALSPKASSSGLGSLHNIRALDDAQGSEHALT